MLRILLCDDHALFREGLRLVLAQLDEEVELVGVADGASAMREAAADDDFDLVLLDLALPDASGLEVLAGLREHHPSVPVAVLSGSEVARDVRSSLDLGAVGFIPKSSTASVLLAAIRLVLSGGIYLPPNLLDDSAVTGSPRRLPRAPVGGPPSPRLSPRQWEVLALLAEGRSNGEIGQALAIASGTVKSHVMRIYEELRVNNRTEAALRFRELDRSHRG
ncbi:MAG: response regulator transcription factor [Myxococcota bacterium]